ncbi:transmembrane protease serine 13-like [Boleophthalmus pectinirostris]|uniref:transmembrane protease serine 13-like n=1 Tax=Boleophthalmus pectinirostris TaxID=150288 RepID=UPI0024308235|nr:transmembrane protease serine 13-like [Boleophthalmus pectinirostris]
MDPPFSSPAPGPELVQSLRSPQLQNEFFRERQRRFCDPQSDDSSPSAHLSPASSSPASSSPAFSSPASSSPASSSPRLSPQSSPSPGFRPVPSLSSAELVAELKSRSEPLRPVPKKTPGLTRVFSGQGRAPANQTPPQHSHQPITAQLSRDSGRATKQDSTRTKPGPNQDSTRTKPTTSKSKTKSKPGLNQD